MDAHIEPCDLTYPRHGDIAVCRLPVNHDGEHGDPHRAGFLASLEARQTAAYEHWVF